MRSRVQWLGLGLRSGSYGLALRLLDRLCHEDLLLNGLTVRGKYALDLGDLL